MVKASRRRLNEKERFLLSWAANGKCVKCDKPLPDSWHADHIEPFCKTGRTNVLEMQAYCPKCNLEKGSKTS